MDNNELGTNLAEVGTDCSEFPNNSDAISRQQVLEALGELATFTEDWSCHAWMYTDDVYNAIKQLPPIQPKRGKWHYSDGKPARIGLSFGVVCDQCGTESEYCTNFCGECGADMRGEQDG